METDEPASVRIAANQLSKMSYNYRDQLSAGFIIAGWDKQLGSQIYTVSLGGSLIQQKVALSGSGSTYIYGFVDTNYRSNMSKDECINFVITG